MSYTGKTNWQFDEVVKEADLNRIEQGLLDAHAGIETSTSEAKAYTDEKVAGITPGAIGAVSKTGDTMSGPLNINSSLTTSQWGSISAASNGFYLIGHNCYLHPTKGTYHYRNTHASLGAKGILFRFGSSSEGIWMFEMGNVATTADAEFTPTLKKLETSEGAQAKANLAETNAKNASLPRSGGGLSGNLGIGSTPSITLAFGDNDTGFKWNGDGDFDIMANNVSVGNVTSAQISLNRPLIVQGSRVPKFTASTAGPSGGTSGDVWHQFI
ncbi:hypothetical protein [Paenibacillus sp. 1001270B_150601_E10]|uniref:hypothetical protein n=1 Tax=Paenibacillus sp. 1001270B_150601_E10 TaxID=2787079 RepID=UPI00189E893F|nr:hypothetical protein [Paenibacillus sp. 1001270B_150601_E10]